MSSVEGTRIPACACCHVTRGLRAAENILLIRVEAVSAICNGGSRGTPPPSPGGSVTRCASRRKRRNAVVFVVELADQRAAGRSLPAVQLESGGRPGQPGGSPTLGASLMRVTGCRGQTAKASIRVVDISHRMFVRARASVTDVHPRRCAASALPAPYVRPVGQRLFLCKTQTVRHESIAYSSVQSRVLCRLRPPAFRGGAVGSMVRFA
jgi:hypothetical protein